MPWIGCVGTMSMKCWIFSSHVEVHIEFGTVVFLTGAYMGGDEGEA